MMASLVNSNSLTKLTNSNSLTKHLKKINSNPFQNLPKI